MALGDIRLVSKLRTIRYLILDIDNDRYKIFDLSCKQQYKAKILHKKGRRGVESTP